MKDLIKKVCLLAIIFMASAIIIQPASAASVYGALYETGNVVSPNGLNKEATLAYYPGEDGFITLTANDNGLEWWTSDALGMNWELADPNPLAAHNCNMAGRHTVVTYNDEVYFAVSCDNYNTGKIFKLTGTQSAELVHTGPVSDQEEFSLNYPTATVLNDQLYMFFDGGFTVCDETTCEDVTDTPDQPDGVPLETSSEQDGYIYLAQTSGEVQKFDGNSYETIGEDFLEGLEIGLNANLPAIEVFNDKVYVGNQDFQNGATLFGYDGTTWEEIITLDPDDTIINKTQVTTVDGSEYLVFYASNGNVGTNIYALDEDENIIQLIDSGLGGTNPENNAEVVSIANRTVNDNGVNKNIMLFGTQNYVDNSKIFALNLDADLAINAVKKNVVKAAGVKKARHQKGEVFKYKIKKKLVQKKAVYSLWVNNKRVDKIKAKKKKVITLKYKKAKKKKVGQVFRVRVGVKHVYGTGSNRKVARNVIKGNKLKVTVRKN